MTLSPYYFTKQANTTYNYTASAARNYTPPAPAEKPIRVNVPTGENVRSAKPVEDRKNGLPKHGTNKPLDSDWHSEFSFLHPFTPTISGTGYGRPYWAQKRNPFEV